MYQRQLEDLGINVSISDGVASLHGGAAGAGVFFLSPPTRGSVAHSYGLPFDLSRTDSSAEESE